MGIDQKVCALGTRSFRRVAVSTEEEVKLFLKWDLGPKGRLKKRQSQNWSAGTDRVEVSWSRRESKIVGSIFRRPEENLSSKA